MRLVIVGDIHLYDLAFRPWQLFGKRLLGQTNLWLNRRHHFNSHLLTPVLEHAVSLQPDWIIFTGDFTTTSLPSEFAMARQTMASILTGRHVLAVPGNHDRYTPGAVRHTLFESYITKPFCPHQTEYPFALDIHPNWRLIGLNSASPRCFNSRGKIGTTQLEKLRLLIKQMNDETNPKGLMVVCHYPTDLPSSQHKRPGHALEDAAQLKDILRQAPGAVVYFHGHIHRPWQWQPHGWNANQCLMVNAGSPCMVNAQYPAGQGLWQVDLPTTTTAISTTPLQPHGSKRVVPSIQDIMLYSHQPSLASSPDDIPTSTAKYEGPLSWHTQQIWPTIPQSA